MCKVNISNTYGTCFRSFFIPKILSARVVRIVFNTVNVHKQTKKKIKTLFLTVVNISDGKYIFTLVYMVFAKSSVRIEQKGIIKSHSIFQKKKKICTIHCCIFKTKKKKLILSKNMKLFRKAFTTFDRFLFLFFVNDISLRLLNLNSCSLLNM